MTALVVMIAPPGAGKSSWTAGRFHRHQVVNLDSIREQIADDPADQGATREAADIQHAMLAARCRRRLLTVVDATNLGGGVRESLLGHAHRNLMLTVAVVLDVPLEVCLIRNRRRDRVVPEHVIVRMHQQYLRSIPAAGVVAGFDVTRRIGYAHDYVAGLVPTDQREAPWLR